MTYRDHTSIRGSFVCIGYGHCNAHRGGYHYGPTGRRWTDAEAGCGPVSAEEAARPLGRRLDELQFGRWTRWTP